MKVQKNKEKIRIFRLIRPLGVEINKKMFGLPTKSTFFKRKQKCGRIGKKEIKLKKIK